MTQFNDPSCVGNPFQKPTLASGGQISAECFRILGIYHCTLESLTLSRTVALRSFHSLLHTQLKLEPVVGFGRLKNVLREQNERFYEGFKRTPLLLNPTQIDSVEVSVLVSIEWIVGGASRCRELGSECLPFSGARLHRLRVRRGICGCICRFHPRSGVQRANAFPSGLRGYRSGSRNSLSRVTTAGRSGVCSATAACLTNATHCVCLFRSAAKSAVSAVIGPLAMVCFEWQTSREWRRQVPLLRRKRSAKGARYRRSPSSGCFPDRGVPSPQAFRL